MTTWLVTRHDGARARAEQNGVTVDAAVEHLDVAAVSPGDVVIGTLPVSLAAEVCAKGAAYWHLAMTVPFNHRGRELQPDDMRRFGATLAQYRVSRELGPAWPTAAQPLRNPTASTADHILNE